MQARLLNFIGPSCAFHTAHTHTHTHTHTHHAHMLAVDADSISRLCGGHVRKQRVGAVAAKIEEWKIC